MWGLDIYTTILLYVLIQTVALMVTLIVFSRDVFQVKDVLSHVQNVPSLKPQAEELFNLLSSLFFLLWKQDIIPQRWGNIMDWD